MSKKLKKKIEEICGLQGLDWEARQDRANQILASSEWKQAICNDLIGLSFRELEQTLSGVASERLKKEESYEHKLEAYKAGKTSRRPKSRSRGSDDSEPLRRGSSDSIDSTRTHSSKSRTLKEILAQVYAPRVVQTLPKFGSSWLFQDRTASEPSDEIPQNSHDEDCITEG